jgi:hypothetical protein
VRREFSRDATKQAVDEFETGVSAVSTLAALLVHGECTRPAVKNCARGISFCLLDAFYTPSVTGLFMNFL